MAARGRAYLPVEVAQYLRKRASTPPEPDELSRPLPDEITESEFEEGKGVSIAINRFERDVQARAACLKHFGAVCQVCETDLADVYGPAAQGLIHVHHIVPLAEIRDAYKVHPTQDLIPVCPNCHAVLHRQRPPFTPKALRAMVAEYGGRGTSQRARG